MTVKRWVGLVLGVVIAAIIACLPAPEGLDATAMRFIGIFIGFIIWMILDVAPEYICALAGLAALLICGVGKFEVVMSAYAGTTVWMVIAGFGLAGALSKCGLLIRIAYFIMRFFPENYRGQVGAMFFSGLVLSPLLPSVAAKSVLMSPFTVQAAKGLGFKEHSKGMSGLWSAGYISSGVMGNAFITGSVYVVIMLGFLSAQEKASWTWLNFLGSTWVWLVVLLILSFIAVPILFKPEQELKLPKGFAKSKSKELGPMSKDEKVAATVIVLSLIMWVTQAIHGVDPAVVAIAALVIIALFGDFKPRDFRTMVPWEMVVLIGGVVSMASLITTLKIDTWLGTTLSPVLSPLLVNPFLMVITVCVVIYVIKFFVPSMVATGTIGFAMFGAVASTVGISGMVLLFAVFTCGQIWYTKFMNPIELGAIAAAGDENLVFKDIKTSSYIYMVANIIALLVSVPLWMMQGLV